MEWDQIFRNSWLVGLIFAGALYLIKFNDMSETELVRWSYLWIPMIVFGVAGSIALKNGISAGQDDPINSAIISAVKWTVVLSAALIIFYETIWDSL